MYSRYVSRKNLLWTSILLMICLSLASVRVSTAQESVTLEVQPDTYAAIHLGETFDINVTISNVTADLKLIGVEFKLRYNVTLLSVVNVTEGPFMKDPSWAFNGTYFLGPKIKEDYVLVGILLMPHEVVGNYTAFPEGSGTLATITFNVIMGAPSSCDLQLVDTKLSNTQMEPISHSPLHGYYEFALSRTIHHIIVWDAVPYDVVTKSNSTVSPVELDQPHRLLSFNIAGPDGTIGFCNITIPKNLLDAPDTNYWLILVDGMMVFPTMSDNATHSSLYFAYSHSIHRVHILGTAVIPEFPTAIVPLLFLAVTLVAVALRKTRRN
ncbi:MAG: cohesin domain-containing protein [Candidatus Hermodarchaeia archaeon]|jgi:hypothetical protein